MRPPCVPITHPIVLIIATSIIFIRPSRGLHIRSTHALRIINKPKCRRSRLRRTVGTNLQPDKRNASLRKFRGRREGCRASQRWQAERKVAEKSSSWSDYELSIGSNWLTHLLQRCIDNPMTRFRPRLHLPPDRAARDLLILRKPFFFQPPTCPTPDPFRSVFFAPAFCSLSSFMSLHASR